MSSYSLTKPQKVTFIANVCGLQSADQPSMFDLTWHFFVVSLENVITDIHELEKGMEMTRRECDMKKPPNPLLCLFIQDNEPRLAQLQKEQRIAVDSFS